MHLLNRRGFLRSGTVAGAACAAGLAGGRAVWGAALGLPVGLQLYSLREQLPADYAGVLKKVGAAGYQEVEAAGFFGHTAAEVKRDMAAAGLRCVGAHYGLEPLQTRLEETIAFHQELGAPTIICPSPGHKDPAAKGELTIEDWRWNADQFNAIGRRVKAAGLQFGYHNHTPEFRRTAEGVVPFDELLRLTDPAVVTFELDCGWVTVGGGDPAAYLHRFPERISMLHVKDFTRTSLGGAQDEAQDTALGKGGVDLRGIFAAAKQSGRVRHYFVEQEHFDTEPFAELRADAAYLQAMS